MHCSYCLDPNTPVLTENLEWKPIREIVIGEKLIAFDEFPIEGFRKTQLAIVENAWKTNKPSLRITTDKGTIICSHDHKFLMGTSGFWLNASEICEKQFINFYQPIVPYSIGEKIKHDMAEVIKIEFLEDQELIDIQTSTRTFYASGFATHNCYHADKKNLPFKQNFMPKEIAFEILRQGAELGVNSVKTNWRGESTMNPNFLPILSYAKSLAKGSTYIERLTNSNFKFDKNRDDIFEGLNCQTKVKISYDSFDPKVFHKQRSGGDHEITTSNIDRFYHWHNRKTEMVIQAVRTQLNKDEDIEGLMRKRWPSATLSIRDVVGGRKKDDISELIVNDRDATERQTCLQAHVRLIFDTNGRASPCCPDIKNDLVLGDITKMSMKDIFNSRYAQNLRKMLNNKTAFSALSTCKNCSSLETFKGFKPSWNS